MRLRAGVAEGTAAEREGSAASMPELLDTSGSDSEDNDHWAQWELVTAAAAAAGEAAGAAGAPWPRAPTSASTTSRGRQRQACSKPTSGCMYPLSGLLASTRFSGACPQRGHQRARAPAAGMQSFTLNDRGPGQGRCGHLMMAVVCLLWPSGPTSMPVKDSACGCNATLHLAPGRRLRAFRQRRSQNADKLGHRGVCLWLQRYPASGFRQTLMHLLAEAEPGVSKSMATKMSLLSASLLFEVDLWQALIRLLKRRAILIRLCRPSCGSNVTLVVHQ